MTLSDQQLRQELINYGENVPPITQRNREQLRSRLEVLQSQTRTRNAAASPSRSQATASPVRTRATASPVRSQGSSNSPSRTRAAASPSRSVAANSPSRTRAAASPSRLAAASSPSRTRSSATTNTTASLPKARSKQSPNLIELSDSDTESSSTGVLLSRSARAGQTEPNVQTRSIALRRQNKSPSSGGEGPGNITNDVELSIARHRREIKQLLDSARDRNNAPNTTTSSLRSGQQRESTGTPIRQSSPSSSSKLRTHRESSKSDNEDDKKSKRSPKSENEQRKKPSALKRVGKPIETIWKKYTNLIKNLLKLLLISSVVLGGIFFVIQKRGDFFPRRDAITCSVKNATECEDMKPVIAAVRKQLQIRTGEVDCGFRPKTDVLVPRQDIERYLNEKGLKFNLGNEERWNALIKYIVEKPLPDILIWNDQNQKTNNTNEARKLSTKEAERSLTCRARQDISTTLRNLILLILGSTGLLTLAWYLQKKSKIHEENERTFKNYLTKATDLLQEQYEKHIQDPQAQPWLAISHIRDKLFPEEDQERLKHIWERVKNEMSKQDTRIRSALHEVNGEKLNVWQWVKSAASSPKKVNSPSKNKIEESEAYTTSEVGLTECLKLRNCFRSDNYADDEEIDHVVDSIQKRCAHVKRIEHIGIHSVFVYLKLSSKEAAGQCYRLLNNWSYQDRLIDVKYIRLNRYYEHFPEAQDVNTNK